MRLIVGTLKGRGLQARNGGEKREAEEDESGGGEGGEEGEGGFHGLGSFLCGGPFAPRY